MGKFIQIGDTVLNVDNISHFSLRSTSRVLDVYLNASPLKPFTYRGERATIVYEKLLALTDPEKWNVPQEPRQQSGEGSHEGRPPVVNPKGL
jgi:hypothetical protein